MSGCGCGFSGCWHDSPKSSKDALLAELTAKVEKFTSEAQPNHDGDPATWSLGFVCCYSKVLALIKEMGK